MPDSKITYSETLDFRIVFDQASVRRHKKQIRENLQLVRKDENNLQWTHIPYKILSTYYTKIEMELTVTKMRGKNHFKNGEMLILLAEHPIYGDQCEVYCTTTSSRSIGGKKSSQLCVRVEILRADLLNRAGMFNAASSLPGEGRLMMKQVPKQSDA